MCRDKKLLSFGDEEEEEEPVFIKTKMKSAHDVLTDSKLSKTKAEVSRDEKKLAAKAPAKKDKVVKMAILSAVTKPEKRVRDNESDDGEDLAKIAEESRKSVLQLESEAKVYAHILFPFSYP